jgi:CheY-like chemotaxis protein
MAQFRILVADDEDYLTQILQSNLQRRGYEVAVARDGLAAYELAVKLVPDLVISDYQMPVLDGLALCIRLKETLATAHIPALMLTARGHRLTPEELERTNIRAVLPKPFSIRELIPKIESLLNGQSAAVRKAAG